MKTPEPRLRILIVVDLPWDARLGAIRVWIELAEEWKNAGHHVERYSLTDAFPGPHWSGRISSLRPVWFPYRARKFLRENAQRFDVVDSHLGTFPFRRSSLHFRGLLVGRSVGLSQLYDRFERLARQRWPQPRKGRLRGRWFYPVRNWWLRRNVERAIHEADLINLPNEDERTELKRVTPPPRRMIVQPYGLSETGREALASAALPPGDRLRKKQIAFIGMWSARKGSHDWGDIIRCVAGKIPEARFLFLGTMTDEAKIFQDLGPIPAGAVRCVPAYSASELPHLLCEAAVGLFPSYLEGFGIAVLEQLAVGIPTIAYDVSGPRQIIGEHAETFLVPSGDVMAMANRAIAILRMTAEDYIELASECHAIAARFRWDEIAAQTVHQYRDTISILQRTSPLGGRGTGR